VKPFTVQLRFHGDLAFFLRAKSGTGVLERTLTEKTSIKDVIESCGVPHPEVDLILLDQQPVNFERTVVAETEIEVFPVGMSPTQWTDKRLQRASATGFIADGHLGQLARNLRLLGFDVVYDQHADDLHLLKVMQCENRALLTRDRRLLMHGVVQTGYCPRSQNGDKQTTEVIRRFELLELLSPFTRCIRCNETLREVAKAEVIERLEPLTKIHYEQFRRCTGCGQVYWAGSHFEKLQKRIEAIQSSFSKNSVV
jgi:hypothetical protein